MNCMHITNLPHVQGLTAFGWGPGAAAGEALTLAAVGAVPNTADRPLSRPPKSPEGGEAGGGVAVAEAVLVAAAADPPAESAVHTFKICRIVCRTV